VIAQKSICSYSAPQILSDEEGTRFPSPKPHPAVALRTSQVRRFCFPSDVEPELKCPMITVLSWQMCLSLRGKYKYNDKNNKGLRSETGQPLDK